MIPLRESVLQSELTEQTVPSRDYCLNFESGRITGYVEGKDAIRQAIRCRLAVQRGESPIFSDDYGLDDAKAYLSPQPEGAVALKNRIRGILCADDRIQSVENFVLTAKSDGLLARFTAVTQTGETEGSVLL